MSAITRPRRLAIAALLLLAACGRATMSPDDATQVAVDAFASAGLEGEVGEVVEGATVDRAIDGEFIQVHQVEMVVDGRSYRAGVDRRLGAVVRLDEPNDTALTDEQVAAIAEYRDNPAEDAARRTRTFALVVVVVLAIVAACLYFRRERLRAEAAADDGAEEIAL